VIVDTNVWVRHLTGDPPDQARLATNLITTSPRLELRDVVVAECVYVLGSVYGIERWRVAEMMRSLLGVLTIVADELTLLRSLELYETRGIGYVDAYLVALSETGRGPVATFDRRLAETADPGSAVLLGE
jgi:predicted nucleic acid-binding protein